MSKIQEILTYYSQDNTKWDTIFLYRNDFEVVFIINESGKWVLSPETRGGYYAAKKKIDHWKKNNVTTERQKGDEILLASRYKGPKQGKLFDDVLYHHVLHQKQSPNLPEKTSNIAVVKATARMVSQRFKECGLDTKKIDDLTFINYAWVSKFLTRHHNDEAWYLLQGGDKQKYRELPTPTQMDVLYQTSENEVFYD